MRKDVFALRLRDHHIVLRKRVPSRHRSGAEVPPFLGQPRQKKKMLSAEKLFWCKEWYAAMADKITDFVYADDSKETFDVINVLLLGWILLGLVVYVLGNVIAAHWRRKKACGGTRAATRTPSSADEGPSTAEAEGEETPRAAAQSAPPADGEVEEEGERDEPLVAEGGELCEWVCGVLGWVRRERVVSPLADAWLDALNASTRIAATEHGVLVDFRSLLPSSRPPRVRAVRESEEQAVECDVELQAASFELGVSGSGEGGGRLPPRPCVLLLHALTGKVWVECSPQDVSFVARFLEPPHMELSVETPNDTQDDVELVERVCRDALRGSCVRLRLACFPECPRPPHLAPSVDAGCAEGRELLVKVVRAENLTEGVSRPYCVLEVDDPPQRHSTPLAQGSDPHFDTPFTISVKDSAELLFEVHDQDKADSDGLVGLCMVEVGDLLRHPRQRQVVPLSSMGSPPLPPTAALTLEFVFSGRVETNSRVTAQGTLITTTTIQRTNQECSLVPLETMPNANANPNPSLHASEETPHPETLGDNAHENVADENRTEEDLVETSAPSVEQAAAPDVVHGVDSLESLDSPTPVPVVDPDALGHSAKQEQLDCGGEQASQEQDVQKVDAHAPNGRRITKFDLHVENVETGPFENGKAAASDGTADLVGNGTDRRKGDYRVANGRKSVPVIKPPPAILVSETGAEAPPGVARGEACVAGRALAQLGSSPSGTSRSTLIIHSVHRPESSLSPESPRSSAPPSPQHKEEEQGVTPAGEGGKRRGVLGALRRRLSLRSRSSERSAPASPRHTLGSTRSSLSEASGVSAATFVHENSTLVIETNENGIVRRYLVPGGGARLRKRPRGAKLHIYNDHVFVARHIPGSVVCCVCARPLTRRPGKQGYECRGCSVRCHKSCHVRIGDFCPNSSVNAMEVEYLQGGASPKSI